VEFCLVKDHGQVFVGEGVDLVLHGHRELFHQRLQHDLLLVNVPLVKLRLNRLHVLVRIGPLNILRFAEPNDDFTLHVLWEESNLIFVEDEHLYFG